MSDALTDAKGRKIEVQEVIGAGLSRFMRICGNAWGENYWTLATKARASVRSIDGKPTPPFPVTLAQVDQLWDAVDEDATAAAIDWMVEKSNAIMDEAKNSSAPQATEAASGS